MATMLSRAPWLLEPSDLDAARSAGLSDLELLHAVVLSAFFNYLNRVADGVDLDFDYESALPRLVRDREREPSSRPEVSRSAPAFAELSFAELPRTYAAFQRWREYMLERTAPLPAADRRILACATAEALADGATAAELSLGASTNEHAQSLIAFAQKLTLAPWKVAEDDLQSFRARGFDDAALLDLISVISFQNAASRIRLSVGYGSD